MPVTKLPVKTEKMEKNKAAAESEAWRPLATLRKEIDRVFEDFGRGFGRSVLQDRPMLDFDLWRPALGRALFGVEPFLRHDFTLPMTPAVDIAERDKQYEIEAEIPGMDEKNLEITLSNGTLTIKGEKKEEMEEKKKNSFLSERRYGSFQRSFQIPAGVDAEKIEATFSKGVLKVILPKTVEAVKKEKKITVKAA